MSQQTPVNIPMSVMAQARDKLEHDYLQKGGNAHTFYIGEIEKDGQPVIGPDGQPQVGLVVLVDHKIPKAQLAPGEAVPNAIKLHHLNVEIPVDIQVAPQPKDLRLSVDVLEAHAGNVAEWRRCHDIPLQGGVQIAPQGARWVGTLSCAVRGRDADGKMIYGALTNRHVAHANGGRRGHKICQPSGDARHFATMEYSAPLQYGNNGQNKVDGSFLNTFRNDGPFAGPDGQGCYTVIPEQYQLGRIVPSPVPKAEQKIGDRVIKSGRTTGIMRGRVVGIGASTHVGYDEGTARFVDQIITRGDSGDMSQPGDSGSLILTEDGLRPYSLLFAGGGGTTISNSIEDVIAFFGLEFF